MGLISQDTAALVWKAHREIIAGEDLLKKMEEYRHEKVNDRAPFRDVFGRMHRCLELGIPSGENCTKLLDVSPDLAVHVIRAHVADKQAELARLCEVARMELEDRVKEAGDS